MGISEFAVHNVLRTYSRQARLGQVRSPRDPSSQAGRTSDQVTVSSAARKAQWIGQFAAELVASRNGDMTSGEAAAQSRDTAEELLARHRNETTDEGLSPEAFEAALRYRYQR